MKKVLILDSFNRYNVRTKYIYGALTSLGYDVKLVQSDFTHFRKKYVDEKHSHVTYVHAKKYTKNLSVDRIMSHLKMGKDMMRVVEAEKPDIVYCLIPINNLAKRLAKYKKKNQVQIYFDIIDLWPETLPVSNKAVKKILFPWKNFRDKNLGCAEKVILECGHYKKFLPKNLDYKTAYLCKESQIENFEYKHGDEIKFLYLGSINNIIDIDSIVKFLLEVKSKRKVSVEIIGGGEKHADFIKALTDGGISYNDNGLVYDEKQKNEIFSSCHFGLNIYKKSTVIGLTIKSIDYFSRGLPIVTKNIADTEEVCKKYTCGIAIDSDGNWDKSLIDSMDAKKWTEYSRNAVRAYEELFTCESFDQLIRSIFTEVGDK